MGEVVDEGLLVLGEFDGAGEDLVGDGVFGGLFGGQVEGGEPGVGGEVEGSGLVVFLEEDVGDGFGFGGAVGAVGVEGIGMVGSQDGEDLDGAVWALVFEFEFC